MITLYWLYALAGAMFATFALLSAFDGTNRKRFGNAAFWGLMALSLLVATGSGTSPMAYLCLASPGSPVSDLLAEATRRQPARVNDRPGRSGSVTNCSCPR